MTYEELVTANPQAAAQWHEHWTQWMAFNGEMPPTDPDRPWLDVFGDDPIEFTVLHAAEKVRAHRFPVFGFDEVHWIWRREFGWIDVRNSR